MFVVDVIYIYMYVCVCVCVCIKGPTRRFCDSVYKSISSYKGRYLFYFP